jgi:protein involved in sex pheromone biosynthesis
MKRALISSLLIVVLASSASAFAQSSNVAPRTRAEVKAELTAARNSGELDAIRSDSYPQLLPYQTAKARGASRTSSVVQANSARISTQ